MSWLAFHRTEAASALIGKHPAAFLLLSCIAIRARYHPDPCPVSGLEFGQCYVGDWKECGQKSYKQYRVSKELLEKMKFAAFKGTSIGTIASLLQVTESSMIYTVSIECLGQSKGQSKGQSRGNQGANEGPLTNKDIRKEGEDEDRPRPPSWKEVQLFAESCPMPVSPECTAKFFDEMESTQWTYRGVACVATRAWHARFRMFITNWNQNEQGNRFKNGQ